MLDLKSLFRTQLFSAARFCDYSVFCQRFLHVLQATHRYCCIPRNLRSIRCARTAKFHHTVTRHWLELCTSQETLGGLTARSRVDDPALAYGLQHFHRGLELEHLLCSADLPTHGRLDLSRGVELTICRPWGKRLLLLRSTGLTVRTVWCTCLCFWVGTPGQNRRGSKQVSRQKKMNGGIRC